MTNHTRSTTDTWSSATLEDIKTLVDCIGHDGHTIWSTDALIARAPSCARALNELTETIESDTSDPKSTIYDTATGVALTSLNGVYGLAALYSLAHHFDPPIRTTSLGRGFQASDLTNGILRSIRQLSA